MQILCKTFIFMTARISDNREMQDYEVFCDLANQIHGHICVMLEFLFYSMENYLLLMFC